MILTLKGRVSSGLGEGKYYMHLSWVRKQIFKIFGFHPYPGTLNLRILDVTSLRLLDHSKGFQIQPIEGYSMGRCFKALIMDRVWGAVVRPNIQNYPEDLLEVIAPINLRNQLNLRDGDLAEVKVFI